MKIDELIECRPDSKWQFVRGGYGMASLLSCPILKM